MSPERVPVGEEGKGYSMLMDQKQKSTRTNSGESGVRNLEAESIRSRAESTGGCVKLKTVTEISWSSARDTFIAESVYLVLNSLLDWEPCKLMMMYQMFGCSGSHLSFSFVYIYM